MAVSPGQITLHPVYRSDLPLLLAWRNDPEIMQYLPSAKIGITWEEHFRWHRESRLHPEVFYWTARLDDNESETQRVIGVAHCDTKTGEIGLIVGEKTLWGQGVGKVILNKAMEQLKEWEVSIQIWAAVHPDNQRSCRLFESLGFVDEGPARNGQRKYVLRLS